MAKKHETRTDANTKRNMKALYFDRRISLRELPVPSPGADEAFIRVRTAGICNTDIEIVRGYMGFTGVPGHEFTGEVVNAPDAKWNGRRVVGEINCGCGRCAGCRRGDARHCARRTVLGILGRGGAFSEYLTLPIGNLHAIPAGMPDCVAVFAEPVAACFEILEQVNIGREHNVAVIGDGKLGMLAGQVLKTRTPFVTLIGKHSDKLNLAKREFGVRTAIVSSANAGRFDVVVECSGNPTGLEEATRIVRPRGTIVLKSTYQKTPRIQPAPWVIHEITIVGSRCGPFKPAMTALKNGTVRVEPLIAGTYPLSRAAQAFRHARKPGALKVLIDISRD